MPTRPAVRPRPAPRPTRPHRRPSPISASHFSSRPTFRLNRPSPLPPRLDPIVIRQCQITLSETQNVPSKNPGRLMHLCTETVPGEIVPKDLIVERERPSPPTKVRYRRTKDGEVEIQPGEVVPADQVIERERANPPSKVIYRRLKEGDVVKAGQLIGYLDDKLAVAQLAIEEAAITANKAKLEAAKQLQNSFRKSTSCTGTCGKKVRAPRATPVVPRPSMTNRWQTRPTLKGNCSKPAKICNKARVILDEHEIRSTIGGKINRFYRKAGESIREL